MHSFRHWRRPERHIGKSGDDVGQVETTIEAVLELIGIGGHLTVPPLPHHRAYGPVPRRFVRIKPQQGCFPPRPGFRSRASPRVVRSLCVRRAGIHPSRLPTRWMAGMTRVISRWRSEPDCDKDLEDGSGGKKGMGREVGPDGVTRRDVNAGKRAGLEGWAGVGRTHGDDGVSQRQGIGSVRWEREWRRGRLHVAS